MQSQINKVAHSLALLCLLFLFSSQARVVKDDDPTISDGFNNFVTMALRNFSSWSLSNGLDPLVHSEAANLTLSSNEMEFFCELQ